MAKYGSHRHALSASNHFKKVAISLKGKRWIFGTRAPSAGKPTTKSKNGRSWLGRWRISVRNFIGLGV